MGSKNILHTVDKRGSDAKLGFLGEPGIGRGRGKGPLLNIPETVSTVEDPFFAVSSPA